MPRRPGPDAEPPLRKRIVDRAAVAVFAGLWCAACARLAPDLFPAAGALASISALASALLPSVLGFLAGYLLADLVAGAVHWIADRHFDPRTPGLGPMLIEPFRAHHGDPLSIARHDVFEVLGNNALVTIPFTALLLAAPSPADVATRLLVATALAGTLFAVATNLFHAWAHDPAPPRIARPLQRAGLILTPERHALHHRAAHDRAYCVTSGWLNAPLDRFDVWARLDAWIARVRRDQPAPR